MAFFGVTIEEIEDVWAHPNADRLDMCRLKGVDFQFITAKGLREKGQKVLYFPLDSLLPLNIAQALGLEGRLAGKDKNRIKSIKLRKEISQGVIGDLSMIEGLKEDWNTENVTEFLGVEKWEPEPIMSSSGNLLPLPEGCSKYDIEGCERYGQVVAELMNEPVWITEKMEGTNGSCFIDEQNKVYINQRGYTIEPIEGKENTYWKAANDNHIVDFAQWLKSEKGFRSVQVLGELCGPGIQCNIYKLKEHTVFIFDIKANGVWLNKKEMIALVEGFKSQARKIVETVPVIAQSVILKDWLDGRTIKEASTDTSLRGAKLREGIVINPQEERLSNALGGRLILKQRSPEYLAKSDN